MAGLFYAALLAMTSGGTDLANLRACARTVGASATAFRLAALPPLIRERLVQRVGAAGGSLADSDAELIETDAPTTADRGHASERFVGGMRVGDRWLVQVRQGLSAGVITFTYVRGTNGDFLDSPIHTLRGPSCPSMQAALAGVIGLQAW